jgi:hypothetical protein
LCLNILGTSGVVTKLEPLFANAMDIATQEVPPLQGCAPPHATLLRRCAAIIGLDRAVGYAVATGAWQTIAGPLTIVFVARFMTPEAQGYYYTFGSILGIKSLLELSLCIVIVTTASHHWAHLSLNGDGRIVGDAVALSRLVSLGRMMLRWYAVVSVLFLAVAGVAGALFFSRAGDYPVSWHGPWIALLLMNSVALFSLPFTSVLEGCNQVQQVNKARFLQSVGSNLAVWVTLALGGGLWAGTAFMFVIIIRDMYLVLWRYRGFFASFTTQPAQRSVLWARDIWPMQWRLGLTSVGTFLTFAVFNPVVFYYHGATEAGRMGMTWTLATAVQSISLAWLYTKMPRFGMLAARGAGVELRQYWARTAVVTVGIAALGAVAVVAAVSVASSLQLDIARRLLGPGTTAVLLLGVVAMQVVNAQVAYMRAHRTEPLAWVWMGSSVIVGAGVWACGRAAGSLGAVLAYTSIVVLLIVPIATSIWYRHQRKWVNEYAPKVGDFAEARQS